MSKNVLFFDSLNSYNIFKIYVCDLQRIAKNIKKIYAASNLEDVYI